MDGQLCRREGVIVPQHELASTPDGDIIHAIVPPHTLRGDPVTVEIDHLAAFGPPTLLVDRRAHPVEGVTETGR
jgi:hypothetical protein